MFDKNEKRILSEMHFMNRVKEIIPYLETKTTDYVYEQKQNQILIHTKDESRVNLLSIDFNVQQGNVVYITFRESGRNFGSLDVTQQKKLMNQYIAAVYQAFQERFDTVIYFMNLPMMLQVPNHLGKPIYATGTKTKETFAMWERLEQHFFNKRTDKEHLIFIDDKMNINDPFKLANTLLFKGSFLDGKISVYIDTGRRKICFRELHSLTETEGFLHDMVEMEQHIRNVEEQLSESLQDKVYIERMFNFEDELVYNVTTKSHRVSLLELNEEDVKEIEEYHKAYSQTGTLINEWGGIVIEKDPYAFVHDETVKCTALSHKINKYKIHFLGKEYEWECVFEYNRTEKLYNLISNFNEKGTEYISGLTIEELQKEINTRMKKWIGAIALQEVFEERKWSHEDKITAFAKGNVHQDTYIEELSDVGEELGEYLKEHSGTVIPVWDEEMYKEREIELKTYRIKNRSGRVHVARK